MRTFIVIVLSASYMACTAEMVSQPGRIDSIYAPINQENRTGVVKYMNVGAQEVREARKEDAYMKMHDACGGSYEIVKEWEGGLGGPNPTRWNTTPYWYIEFRCVETDKTELVETSPRETTTALDKAPPNPTGYKNLIFLPLAVFAVGYALHLLSDIIGLKGYIMD